MKKSLTRSGLQHRCARTGGLLAALFTLTLTLSLSFSSSCGGGASETPNEELSCDPETTAAGYQACDNTCRRPGGYVCAYGTGMDRCASDDGVNECDCYAGSGSWACTQVLVPPGSVPTGRPTDAPAWPGCRGAADCTASYGCRFDADPRETLGRCVRQIQR